jgi:starch synthase (maltosyl-transferring)
MDDRRHPARHPDVMFLAEAFTRPKMMYRLAKIGFSQSYTYFTWRNTKAELTEYLTELTHRPVREFFRPHFFVNTPDINPVFLQTSGRAGFLIRAALAATLSGLWGVYSGFELCEAAPCPGARNISTPRNTRSGRDWAAPGNIVAEITALNRMRRQPRRCSSPPRRAFHNAFNDQVLSTARSRPARRHVLVAVSLDPHHAQEALRAAAVGWACRRTARSAEDLMTGETFHPGPASVQHMRLDPRRPLRHLAPVAA